MKERIKEYLKLKIVSKKMMIREIKRIDKVVKQLAEVTAGQQLLFEEYSKESYKEKYKNEHKKVKELEKRVKEILENEKNKMV